MPATIRRLGTADVDLARAMNALFAAAFEDPAHYADAPPDDAWLRDALGRESVVALVAELGDRIVGAAVAYELDKLEQRRRELYLYDLAVAADCRRRGVATALIEALRRHAAARNCWTLFVQADYGDDPAVALYTKLGSREDVMHFDIAPADAGEIGPID
ncbi:MULTISPECIES: AAC(3)-I family aminoglycoside N-acetyltransferase [Sphingomonas]|uniref:AAC(3)-I family aminoglycoside N-acetyltransferase n=1 Tax=Sphingomonas TaxID=13687 RepID=UPI00082E1CFF|nr:AAC(3)-I family aminoglycoside N-acetyltransferase [Sphingomonas sp. CCH10-B3]